MEFSKSTRAVMAFGLVAILIFVPLRVEIGYPAIYYAIVAVLGIRAAFLLINDKKSEERFFRSWERKKSWPKPVIVLLEALKSLVFVLFILAFGQIVVNGYDFIELLKDQPLGIRIILPAMVIGFSAVLGFVNLYEKNRKYDRLYAQYHP